MFVNGIDHEEGIRQTFHVLDAAKGAVHLAALALQANALLLGQVRFFIGQQHLDLFEAFDRLPDGAEVGHRAAEPAVVHVEHATALGLFANSILSLALGADKEHVAAVGGEVANEFRGVFEMVQRFLEIDDVDAVALAEDIGLHLRVPPPSLVPEVNASFEQLLHLDIRHEILPYLLENWKRLRALGWPYFLRSTLRASRVKKPTAFSCGRNSALYSSRAREMPWRIAPA